MYQLYTSNYGEVGTFESLHVLKEHGYRSTFISTQDTKHFEMKQRLKEAGFDDIVDGEDLSYVQYPNDYKLKGYTDAISEVLQRGRSFIHILNSQTHSRYSVEKKEKYNRYKNNEDKGRYLNAVDESLDIVYDMLVALQADGVLDNTMVILTGDHGQSFGEEGYFTHSCATVNPQVKIPLCIFNRHLPMLEAEEASLMDLLPTISDLLGVEQPLAHKDGLNFATQQRNYLFMYSETRGYNSPSNLCVLRKNKKYYVDLLKSEARILDIDDKEYTGEKLKGDEIRQIVFAAASKHKVLD
ncbi:hypothetical protein CS022_06770 [Veronia nyctiphanis]|uniref:Sulfatase N-terminal domain-containing protein n=1 Tax=Veronia nyctiphanis TaxID=1278244 RepID=A0A4Q0YRZ0_9GAMM|nr:hypothetical protein CS022_06770 [Veronia nyctiphanis]